MKFLYLLVTVLSIRSGESFINVYGNIKEEPYRGNPGEPLILTPLIRQNKTELARTLSRVHLDELPNIESYSGYLTVNEEFNSNLFFWFFPAQNYRKYAPVILWLQGGPGATSMIGLFTENGPIWIDKNSTLQLRKDHWTIRYSVLYIDNPVGSGYSFTDEGGYAQNQTIIGNQLYVALLQFFQLFPEFQKNEFYAAGESYAGKYVPAISYAIHRNNPTAKQKINLMGLIIASGFVDPVNQIKYGNYFYHNGLIDANTKELMHQHEETVIQLIQQNKFVEAYQAFGKLILGDSTFFKNVTGFSNHLNYLFSEDNTSDDIERMGKFIQNSNIRSKIHVGNAKFHSGDAVAKNLEGDMMKSVVPWLSELLNYYGVLIYSGHLDIITPYTTTVNYIQKLQFNGSEYYNTSMRHQIYDEVIITNYMKIAGCLHEGVVLNAGHMTSRDQASSTLYMVSLFIDHDL